MDHEGVRRLLDRVGVIRHACDLDLLVFFARHPRALVTSEQLAGWLGHELTRVADSLEMLLDAGLLTRAQHSAHAARMYVFAVDGSHGTWVPALLELVSARAGRLSVKHELSRRAQTRRNSALPRGTRPARPFVLRRRPDAPESKAR